MQNRRSELSKAQDRSKSSESGLQVKSKLIGHILSGLERSGSLTISQKGAWIAVMATAKPAIALVQIRLPNFRL